MSNQLNDDSLDVLFSKARTNNGWADKPVTDDILRQLYDVIKWGGRSSLNCSSMRILFLRSQEEKKRLLPALAPSNVDSTMIAPVTAIIGNDGKFYEQLARRFQRTDSRSWFANMPELTRVSARRNSSLQCAYFMIAAYSLGLDCGPMSGFDDAKVDHEFFPAEQRANFELEYLPDSHIKTSFLCNLGYGDPAKFYTRDIPPDFAEAGELL